MNANDASLKANPRLNRIQKISRILKVCVLFYLLFRLCFLVFTFKSIHLPSGMLSVSAFDVTITGPPVWNVDLPLALSWAASAVIYLLGVISFYRLLCLYEKGIFFSAVNVSEMKRLGSYMAVYAILAAASDAIFTIILTRGLRWMLLMEAFSPWILVGGAIYIIAWIMDEGRKIQEEQALTV